MSPFLARLLSWIVPESGTHVDEGLAVSTAEVEEAFARGLAVRRLVAGRFVLTRI